MKPSFQHNLSYFPRLLPGSATPAASDLIPKHRSLMQYNCLLHHREAPDQDLIQQMKKNLFHKTQPDCEALLLDLATSSNMLLDTKGPP